jgi:pimeloyl-ACP methyl ester carboxylesterase
MPMIETATEFSSFGTGLVGRLIEPDGPQNALRPLVVMVHGSERTPAIGNPYAYALAAQGVAVFVYDKRGTGQSQGQYTQNFELLADDAAAAFRHATALARGRYGRAGYFGGSQGGWVAPLAATRSQADFVVVGFGLVASPIEEDREQMLMEARDARLDAQAIADIKRLSSATAAIVVSRFTRGFERLDALRRSLQRKPWVANIKGEYSGDMLRMSDADLRRVGRARFDSLGLIWDYDASAALRRLDVPLLWILAAEDREAPVETTRDALLRLKTRRGPVHVFQFPHTDHGMFEFVADAKGNRQYTRITEGYLKLIADWMHGTVSDPYGRGERLR